MRKLVPVVLHCHVQGSSRVHVLGIAVSTTGQKQLRGIMVAAYSSAMQRRELSSIGNLDRRVA